MASASDEDIARGGVTLIALRLALGQSAVGPTGRPRPVAGSVGQDGIRALGGKAEAAAARLRAKYPAKPDTGGTLSAP